MARPKILHMITPGRNVSAFDANMAADAGYEIIIPHTEVTIDDISDLVQDAIFSRPPKNAASTGLFIGGHDVNVVADMLEVVRSSTVPPFELSVFADPNGAFTTSGALIALIEEHLRQEDGKGLDARTVKIFGGGPVGLCSAILALNLGAKATLARLTANARSDSVRNFASRYDMEIPSESAIDDSQRIQAVSDAEVIICTAKAGVQVLDKSMLDQAERLLVAVDVNAVPPSGIEGVGASDNGNRVETARGSFAAMGALGIGGLKYKVQNQLFERMLTSQDSVVIDLPEAFDEAVKHVG
ncbi:MAG: methylenetetrahydromethanopterin dehydrogenase [Acidiferrobacterales bacterium]|nr:methylenetetrahydromethanopterin dehydrogenase [Acidiferrobacterales bacterium]